MSDKQYKLHMEAIIIHQKTIIAEFKYKHQPAHLDWLCLMGLMETCDLIDD